MLTGRKPETGSLRPWRVSTALLSRSSSATSRMALLRRSPSSSRRSLKPAPPRSTSFRLPAATKPQSTPWPKHAKCLERSALPPGPFGDVPDESSAVCDLDRGALLHLLHRLGVRVDVLVHPAQGSVRVLGADGFGDAPVSPDRRPPDVTVDETLGVGGGVDGSRQPPHEPAHPFVVARNGDCDVPVHVGLQEIG